MSDGLLIDYFSTDVIDGMEGITEELIRLEIDPGDVINIDPNSGRYYVYYRT